MKYVLLRGRLIGEDGNVIKLDSETLKLLM